MCKGGEPLWQKTLQHPVKKKPSGLSDKVSDIVLVVICAAIMLIVAYPLYYVLVASFSDPYDVYAGKTFLLPSQFTLKGYQAVFADSALFSGFVNSIKYTVIGTIYSVVMIYLVAYPLSVKDLPGRKYISLFFVITMYFGGGLVPTLPHRQADRSAGQYVGAVPARCRGGRQCHHRPQLL